MKVISEEYIRLTEEYSWKLDVVASAILEEKTKKQLSRLVIATYQLIYVLYHLLVEDDVCQC